MTDAYARAGVNIDAGNETVGRYREVTSDWRHPDQLGELGGFSGLFRLPGDGSRALVASADGVGTKILIAAQMGRYDGVGRDLVNHCVNDILVVSATPLFFLDYLAVAKLEPAMAADVVRGVAQACRANGMALLGGETAEMPGLYRPGDFDLAGTIVGVVDIAQIPNKERVAEGDAILGLPSIGLHTNGYSLARALIAPEEYAQPFDGTTFGDALLAPHPSYANEVRAIQAVADVKAMAHITGGGLIDNVPRTLPEACRAVFEQSRWSVPPLMAELVRRGNLGHEERYRTLNMGVGYTLVVPFMDAAKAIAAVPSATVVGFVSPRPPGGEAVVVHPARG
ncbi:MAG: phosphoribosylformylglycinamidine cyclo-ligase [Candidatus Lustribacter sp.]|jgi:phosphoribosylformylglycinamidine cyclo-ligase